MFREFCKDVNFWRVGINDILLQTEELRTAAANTTMALTPNRTFTVGGSKDRIGSIMDKVIDMEAEVRFKAIENEHNHAIMCLYFSKLTEMERIDLRDRYCKHKMPYQIAAEMGITTRAERDRHINALNIINNFVKNAKCT